MEVERKEGRKEGGKGAKKKMKKIAGKKVEKC